MKIHLLNKHRRASEASCSTGGREEHVREETARSVTEERERTDEKEP